MQTLIAILVGFNCGCYDLSTLRARDGAEKVGLSDLSFPADLLLPVDATPLADPVNIALGKVTTASITVSGSPSSAVDGDISTAGQAWVPGGDAPIGTWWQVDLGALYNVYRVIVFASVGNPHDWYKMFHIEGSLTGAFAGEQSTLAVETGWDTSRRQNQSVAYTFAPRAVRYVRLVTDHVDDWNALQEVEIYRVY